MLVSVHFSIAYNASLMEMNTVSFHLYAKVFATFISESQHS